MMSRFTTAMAFRLIFAKAMPEAAKSQFARFKIAVSGEVLNWTEAAEALDESEIERLYGTGS